MRIGLIFFLTKLLIVNALAAENCGRQECSEVEEVAETVSQVAEIVVVADQGPASVCGNRRNRLPADSVKRAMVVARRLDDRLSNLRSVTYSLNFLEKQIKDSISSSELNRLRQRCDARAIQLEVQDELSKNCSGSGTPLNFLDQLLREVSNYADARRDLEALRDFRINIQDRNCLRPQDVGFARWNYQQENSEVTSRNRSQLAINNQIGEAYQSTGNRLRTISTGARCDVDARKTAFVNLRRSLAESNTPVDLLRIFPVATGLLRIHSIRDGERSCRSFYELINRLTRYAEEMAQAPNDVPRIRELNATLSNELDQQVSQIGSSVIADRFGDVCEDAKRNVLNDLCKISQGELLSDADEVSRSVNRFQRSCPGGAHKNGNDLYHASRSTCSEFSRWVNDCNHLCPSPAGCKEIDPIDPVKTFCDHQPADIVCRIRAQADAATAAMPAFLERQSYYGEALNHLAEPNLSSSNSNTRQRSVTNTRLESRGQDLAPSNSTTITNTTTEGARAVTPGPLPFISPPRPLTELATNETEQPQVGAATVADRTMAPADNRTERSAEQVSDLRRQIAELESRLRTADLGVQAASLASEVERQERRSEQLRQSQEELEVAAVEESEAPALASGVERRPASVIRSARANDVPANVTTANALAPSVSFSGGAQDPANIASIAAVETANFQSVARSAALAGFGQTPILRAISVGEVPVISASGQLQNLIELPAPAGDIANNPAQLTDYVREQSRNLIGEANSVIIKLTSGDWFKVERLNDELVVTRITREQLAQFNANVVERRATLRRLTAELQVAVGPR